MLYRLASLFLFLPFHAMAAADLCDRSALRAAAETGVPPALMLAITRVETGRGNAPWPWTLNIDGQGHFFPTQAEAVAAAETALSGGAEQVDIGCFQLNLQWHGDHFSSLDRMIDPDANAFHAARFLSDLRDETGDWRAAAAAYHSRTPALGEAYVAKVESTHAATAAAAPPPEPRAGVPNRFPLLMAGAAGAAGSIVPRGGIGLPLVGGP